MTTIVLVSSDGEIFQVSEAVAKQSVTIQNIIEDDCATEKIPLPNVHSKVLTKVIEFCRRHAGIADAASSSSSAANKETDQSLKKFDDEYASSMKNDQEMLFDTLLAANYLNIEKLLHLLCQTVADMMKGKTPDQIRETFNIVNDYTKEEEDAVRRENAWAFE